MRADRHSPKLATRSRADRPGPSTRTCCSVSRSSSSCLIDSRADSACPAAAQKAVDRAAMLRGDPAVDQLPRGIVPCRKPCAFEQVIGCALERRDDHDGGPAIDAVQDDSRHGPNAVRRGERRAAELEDAQPVDQGELGGRSSWACGPSASAEKPRHLGFGNKRTAPFAGVLRHAMTSRVEPARRARRPEHDVDADSRGIEPRWNITRK